MVLVLPPLALWVTWWTSHADVQGRAGRARPGAEVTAAQEDGQPARTRQQVRGLADDGLLDRLPGPGGVRRGLALGDGATVVAMRSPSPGGCPRAQG